MIIMFNQNLKNKKMYTSDKENSFKKIIYAYKKLKQIAKYESISNENPASKVASLTNEQLEKIKLLEARLGCRLVAYENIDLNYRKGEILDGLHLLLDEYLSLYTNKSEANRKTESKTTNKVVQLKKELVEPINEDFNGFFQ